MKFIELNFNQLKIYKFYSIGLIITIINFIIFHLLTKVFEKTFVLVVVYWLIGLNLKFFIYKNFVFKPDIYNNLRNKLLKFYFLYIVIFVLNYIFLEFAKYQLSYNLTIAQIIYVLAYSPISYFVMNRKIFNN